MILRVEIYRTDAPHSNGVVWLTQLSKFLDNNLANSEMEGSVCVITLYDMKGEYKDDWLKMFLEEIVRLAPFPCTVKIC
jgi:hypothetical protein